jgi:hypothetical protein
MRFAEMIEVRRVDLWLATWDSFLNVNTPADFAVGRLLAVLATRGGCALGTEGRI